MLGRIGLIARIVCLTAGIILVTVSVTQAQVTIGRGGTGPDQSDTDLIVYDPFFTTFDRELNFWFNASVGDLRLGSGNTTNGGDDGDLNLEMGNGLTGISLSGSGAFGTFGVTGNPGDIFVRDTTNINTVTITGSSGTVSNSLAGNGVVKAWCQVSATGNFIAGYRCNSSVTETRRITDPGNYEVDFTALSSDIRSRSYVISCTDPDASSIGCEEVTGVARSGDTSSIFVQTRNSDGTTVNSVFTILIY